MPAKSKAQKTAMCMALAARKGDLEVSKLKGAALEIYNSDMTNKEIEEFTVMESLQNYINKNMKNLVEYINEAIGETDRWTYLCCLITEKTNWFNGGFFNPSHGGWDKVDKELVAVTTNKNLNNDTTPMTKAFKKKYGSCHGRPHMLLSSNGDIKHGKLINKIVREFDKGKLDYKTIIEACEKAGQLRFDGKIRLEDQIEVVAKELNIK